MDIQRLENSTLLKIMYTRECPGRPADQLLLSVRTNPAPRYGQRRHQIHRHRHEHPAERDRRLFPDRQRLLCSLVPQADLRRNPIHGHLGQPILPATDLDARSVLRYPAAGHLRGRHPLPIRTDGRQYHRTPHQTTLHRHPGPNPESAHLERNPIDTKAL